MKKNQVDETRIDRLFIRVRQMSHKMATKGNIDGCGKDVDLGGQQL